MTRASDPPVDGDPPDASLDAELGRILEAYLADLEAGRPVDPERLLAEHPSLAGPLRSCLAVVNLADRVADGSGSRNVPGCAASGCETTASGPAPSALTTLGLGNDAGPRIYLREMTDEPEPMIRPHSDAMPVSPEAGLGRYQFHGEIARGGMGAVLKGRDVDLGRDLAIKVLLEAHRDHPDIVRRFVEEAQIGGQLQHPGIVPVYELGAFPDRRPYFAMKLVKGRTLAAMLQERPDPRHELPRFLSIFEQVCQTMAYAHARGVIHRDLKPSNIMVGSFGEVQVMDWGLAKVLPQGGIADEGGSRPAQETVIMTVRSGPAGSDGESQPGSVLGTPSYMAPEQARGDIDQVDERSDVFGLGAILCEVLTGRPPFGGSTREAIREKAARGNLDGAMRRLDACVADADLIALSRDCLAAEPEQRPRNAGEVARRMSEYQTGVQDRLRAAELARVEAQTRAIEERKRRRVTVALAASVVGFALMGGGGWIYLARQRMEWSRQIDRAASGVEALYAEATHAGDDLTRWAAARQAARSLEQSLADAPDRATRGRLTDLARAVAAAAAAAETSRRLLDTLADIRSARGDDLSGTVTDMRYADAYRQAGIDLDAVAPADAAAIIRAWPAATRVAVVTSLDDWAAVLSTLTTDRAGARRLKEIASLADPDPWRNRLRAVAEANSRQEKLKILKELSGESRVRELPAISLCQLGAKLLALGDCTTAESILRDAQRRHPEDVWVNLELARALEALSRREEAIRYYAAAGSLQPASAHELAHALERKGETDEAIAILKNLTRLKPKQGWHLECLGTALKDQGRIREAQDAADAAISNWRAAVELEPGSPIAHAHLGAALSVRGKREEAIAEYRIALRLKPDLTGVRNDLGIDLREQGKLDEAIAEFRAALRLKPDFTLAHSNLGIALRDQGKLGEAIAEYRTALRLEPDLALAHSNLGTALRDSGKLEEAIAEYRAALRLKPDFAPAHNNLGVALRDSGKLEEAIAEYRTALRLKPDQADVHTNLSVALRDQGKLEEAIAELRVALRLKPDLAEAHGNLGTVLRDQGKLEEAIAEYRTALRLKPDLTDAHGNLGNALRDQGKLEEAIAEFRTALRLEPDRAVAHGNLGNVLRGQGKLEEAIAEYRTALRLKPDLAEAHANLGIALCDQGKLEEAIAEYRTALRLKPDLAEAHAKLGIALRDQGKLEEAIAEYRTALRLKPDLTDAHGNLGNALRDQGKLEEAIAEFRAALRLKPDLAIAHNNLGSALLDQGKLEEAIAEYRAALRLNPAYSKAHTNLGIALRTRGEYSEAIAELHKAREQAKATNPRLAQRAERELTATEQQASLAARLPAVLAGQLKPADPTEALGLARLCYEKKLHGASARFWAQAFQAEPKLADDMQVHHRYNAACAAALAGCGQGKDDPPLDDAVSARWRKQAIEWLKADLAAWSKILENGPPQARPFITQTLGHWKADPDLAGLREPGALARLADDEQKACRGLWSEVDALLKKARDNKP